MAICSGCEGENDRFGQRYCRACHRSYMRRWRKGRPLTKVERFKDAARSQAGVYKRRGKIVPEPCSCGSEAVEMHHDDYRKPRDVIFMCRPCHMELHRNDDR